MCCEAVKNEFTIKNVGFNRVTPDDFQRSKLNCCGHTLVYAGWKLFGFLLMFSYILYKNIVELPLYGGRVYVYSSCWALLMAMFYFGLSFIVVACYRMPSKSEEATMTTELSLHHKLIWVLHSMTFSWSMVATTVYWIFRFDQQDMEFERELASHGLGITLMTFDLFMISFPVRILHFVYGFGFCAFYIVFTVFHWLAGGAPIYFLLDWDQFPKAVLCGFGVLSSITFSHVFVFCLWKLISYCYDGPCISLKNNHCDDKSMHEYAGPTCASTKLEEV